MQRKGFSNAEDNEMIDYWHKQLKARDPEAFQPFGHLFWKAFIRETKSNRSEVTLASHFRKQVYTKLPERDMPTAKKIEIYQLYGDRDKLNPDTIKRVEYSCGVTINIDHKGKIASYETSKGIKKRKSCDSPQNVDKPYPKRRKCVILADDEEAPANDSNLTKSQATSDEAIQIDSAESMPDENDFNVTREVQDIKRQCRVRHSLLEAAGRPPVSSPVRSRNIRRHIKEELLPDASFNSENGSMQDVRWSNNSKHTLFPEGQGDGIATHVDIMLSPIIESPKVYNKITERFRKDALQQIALRLNICHPNLTELIISEIRLQEVSLITDDITTREYLEKLALLAENTINTIKMFFSPTYSTTKSNVIRLMTLNNNYISSSFRSRNVSELWAKLIKELPIGFLSDVIDYIERNEPLIVATVKNKDDYCLQLQGLFLKIRKKIIETCT